MKQGILEEVKEHTDWVNSYVIVEKDSGNHHSPNHTVKKKLRIWLDPRDLNEVLEREPCHTHSAEEITAKILSRDSVEHGGHFPASMEMCMDDHLTLTPEKIQQKQFQGKTSEQCCSAHGILPNSQKNTVLSHTEFPPERMVGVAKKFMDKAGKEGKPWISGLYEYRVTPQSGSIALPLQLITQQTPREKDLPQLPSTLGAREMYQTRQEPIKRQQNKPEKSYIELTPGTPVWVQHRQNTTWEPTTVVSQCTTNSYWIMQENGTEQLKVYRRTRSMLKIRSTPTEVEQTRYRNSQSTESEEAEFHTPAIPNTIKRLCLGEFSRKHFSRPCTNNIAHTGHLSSSFCCFF